MKYSLENVTAFDYERQKWVDGAEALPVRIEQLKKGIAALAPALAQGGEQLAELLRFVEMTDAEARAQFLADNEELAELQRIKAELDQPKPRGLRAHIFKGKYGGQCSNGGISERCFDVTLCGPEFPEISEATDEAPAVCLVRRNIGGRDYVHAEPLHTDGKKPWYMAGGCYIATSDSRFGEAVRNGGYPVSFHDYTEGTK